MHPHAMLAQYMHPLQTSTLFFKGILKGLLVDPLVFCSNPKAGVAPL